MEAYLLDCAKISRPALSEIILRQRLFNRLEQYSHCDAIWVTGPPGSGKTSLVSTYINKQKKPCLWYKVDSNDSNPVTFFNCLRSAAIKRFPHLNDLPDWQEQGPAGASGFNENSLATLFNHLQSSLILVLDDYHEISEEIVLHDYILEAVQWLPDEVKIIFVSRRGPSSKFSRLKANRMMKVVQGQELRFTTDEFYEIVDQLGYDDLPQKTLCSIYEIMDGWGAGLLLMLEASQQNHTAMDQAESGIITEIFNYFDEEIFECLEVEVKHFLLKTSLFSYVTEQLALDVTTLHRADGILEALHHNNIFTAKVSQFENVVYQYHPMFRKFLTKRLAEYFSPEEVYALQLHAAKLLQEDDRFEEAAELLLTAGEWDGFIDIVLQNAPVLISQGRHRFLAKWLTYIPREKIYENPWLSYWLGSCLEQLHSSKARNNYKMAFESFCSLRDMAGAFTAWIGMVNTVLVEWQDFTRLDPLLYWLEAHYEHESGKLSDNIKIQVITSMTAALMVRRPGSQEFYTWLERTDRETQKGISIEGQLQACLVKACYSLWIGDQSSCWFLLGKIKSLSREQKATPFSTLRCNILEAEMHAWYSADGTKCLQIVNEALEFAESSGVHVMDHILYVMGASGAMIKGDYALAADFIQKIETRIAGGRGHCFYCYQHLSAWLSLMRGNVLRAVKHAEEALEKAGETGFIFYEAIGRYAKAQILYKKEKIQEAFDELAGFEQIADSTRSRALKFMYLLAKADFMLDQCKEAPGVQYLEEAMKTGCREKYINMIFWWDPGTMTRLCKRALEDDIEVEYVRDLIRSRELVPGSPPVEIEQWPWLVRIYTLGRFEIVKDGTAIRCRGKAQQKPLNMLKALVTLGGRGVSALQLADVLWPDADGDMQIQSLKTTLHRLRRILGKNDLIDFHDGHLSINPRYCWVDSWAFERLLSQSEYEFGKNDNKCMPTALRCCEKAIDLYKGEFLPQNNMEYSCVHMREHLKSRFLRGIQFLGRNFEKNGEHDKAKTRYLQALEVDPMMEEFYQRLMIYYQRLGRNAEAASVYERCRKNFNSVLNIGPSQQTQAIFKSLVNGCSDDNGQDSAQEDREQNQFYPA